MSGHSHWHNIKFKKELTDKKRGKTLSKISRLITVAAKEKGADPETNPKLKLAIEKAKEAIRTVAEWAKSRGLDYAIETVFKKWLELDRLKPKEIVKKPFYRGDLMVWSETRKKWYVIDTQGSWLEFAGKKEDIEWRIVK